MFCWVGHIYRARQDCLETSELNCTRMVSYTSYITIISAWSNQTILLPQEFSLISSPYKIILTMTHFAHFVRIRDKIKNLFRQYTYIDYSTYIAVIAS